LNLPAGERVPTASFWDEFGPMVINVAIIAVTALLLAATR
jgi:hypothetical protein